MNPIPGYIIEVDPPRGRDIQRVEFSSFEAPQLSVEPNYDRQSVRGRSTPYRFFADTGPETWNWTIHLVSSIEASDSRTPVDVYNEHLIIKAIAAYPDYGVKRTGPVTPPSKVKMKWGKSISMVGVILSPNFTWVPPYDDDGYPFGIDVTFSFEVDNEDNEFKSVDSRSILESLR